MEENLFWGYLAPKLCSRTLRLPDRLNHSTLGENINCSKCDTALLTKSLQRFPSVHV